MLIFIRIIIKEQKKINEHHVVRFKLSDFLQATNRVYYGIGYKKAFDALKKFKKLCELIMVIAFCAVLGTFAVCSLPCIILQLIYRS